MKLLDSPLISSIVFHPRGEGHGYTPSGIPTRTAGDGADITGYLHLNDNSDALLLFFHGNGEIAADYDDLAPLMTNCGMSFWVVDYRGYGRSTGTPAYTRMFTDADALFDDIPRLENLGHKSFKHVLVMGRSLGSASAIYLAATRGQDLDGIVLDSPFAFGPRLIHRLGGPDLTTEDTSGFEDNIDHMGRCGLPLLIIHGTEDVIIPFSDAQALYQACRSESKHLVEIRGAGHNDLLYRGFETYIEELKKFIQHATG